MKQKYRVRPQDFTRDRALPFPRVVLMILQKTTRSVQKHLHDFLEKLSEVSQHTVTPGAWSQARVKMRFGFFIELNQEAVVKQIYSGETDFVVNRWNELRVLAVDSSRTDLPNSEEVVAEFGWTSCQNQSGASAPCVQGRLSVLYDVLNQIALETTLSPTTVGERQMGRDHLRQVAKGDVVLADRGYCGYEWFCYCLDSGADFVCRCERSGFAVVEKLFEENIEGKSIIVELKAPDSKAVRKAQLPPTITLRFVTVRLSTGELEVLATSLLDEKRYPTESFHTLYGHRWGIETYYDVLKNRLALENFSGTTLEAVRQDLHASIFLSNYETVVTRPAQSKLDNKAERKYPAQVNHSVSFHAIKSHIIDLLMSKKPIPEVLSRMEVLFLANPGSRRPGRSSPRKKLSGWIRYRFAKTRKKAVF